MKLQEESDDKLVSWTAFRLCALPEKIEQVPKISQSSQGLGTILTIISYAAWHWAEIETYLYSNMESIDPINSHV